MSEEKRRKMADRIVEILQDVMQEKDNALGMKIHWDDCDMYYRRFWFWFSVPSVSGLRKRRSDIMTRTARGIMSCRAKMRNALPKEFPDHEVYVEDYCKPKPKHEFRDGEEHFTHYDSASWVYVVTIVG